MGNVVCRVNEFPCLQVTCIGTWETNEQQTTKEIAVTIASQRHEHRLQGDEAQGQNREAQRLRSFNGSVYEQIVDEHNVQQWSEDSTREAHVQQ